MIIIVRRLIYILMDIYIRMYTYICDARCDLLPRLGKSTLPAWLFKGTGRAEGAPRCAVAQRRGAQGSEDGLDLYNVRLAT